MTGGKATAELNPGGRLLGGDEGTIEGNDELHEVRLHGFSWERGRPARSDAGKMSALPGAEV